MAHALATGVRSAAAVRRSYPGADPLDAIRGIMFASLTSLLLFWLPLAIALRW